MERDCGFLQTIYEAKRANNRVFNQPAKSITPETKSSNFSLLKLVNQLSDAGVSEPKLNQVVEDDSLEITHKVYFDVQIDRKSAENFQALCMGSQGRKVPETVGSLSINKGAHFIELFPAL
ncbi:hypothetical protein PTKIN_Ptkin16aG0541700 [Pterospermum kingtungense]